MKTRLFKKRYLVVPVIFLCLGLFPEPMNGWFKTSDTPYIKPCPIAVSFDHGKTWGC